MKWFEKKIRKFQTNKNAMYLFFTNLKQIFIDWKNKFERILFIVVILLKSEGFFSFSFVFEGEGKEHMALEY